VLFLSRFVAGVCERIALALQSPRYTDYTRPGSPVYIFTLRHMLWFEISRIGVLRILSSHDPVVSPFRVRRAALTAKP